MTPLTLILAILAPVFLCVGSILLVLWRVECFLQRTLAYIKAETVYGAETALHPPKEQPIPVDEVTRLRQLQEQAYAAPQ